MIEIIVLWQLGRRIAERAALRGRRGGRYVLLLVVLWFGGEFTGGISAGIVMGVLGALQADYFPFVVYVSAIAGAAAGAWIAFAVASRDPALPTAEFDDPGPVIVETN